MKTLNVVAAVIKQGGEILATQRGYGDWEGWWEFPGGKVEPGEAPEEALAREIREELGAAIVVGERLCSVEYDYGTFHLSMDCFLCELGDSDFELREHHAARWLDASTIDSVKWLPADESVIRTIKERVLPYK